MAAWQQPKLGRPGVEPRQLGRVEGHGNSWSRTLSTHAFALFSSTLQTAYTHASARPRALGRARRIRRPSAEEPRLIFGAEAQRTPGRAAQSADDGTWRVDEHAVEAFWHGAGTDRPVPPPVLAARQFQALEVFGQKPGALPGTRRSPELSSRVRELLPQIATTSARGPAQDRSRAPPGARRARAQRPARPLPDHERSLGVASSGAGHRVLEQRARR